MVELGQSPLLLPGKGGEKQKNIGSTRQGKDRKITDEYWPNESTLPVGRKFYSKSLS